MHRKKKLCLIILLILNMMLISQFACADSEYIPIKKGNSFIWRIGGKEDQCNYLMSIADRSFIFEPQFKILRIDIDDVQYNSEIPLAEIRATIYKNEDVEEPILNWDRESKNYTIIKYLDLDDDLRSYLYTTIYFELILIGYPFIPDNVNWDLFYDYLKQLHPITYIEKVERGFKYSRISTPIDPLSYTITAQYTYTGVLEHYSVEFEGEMIYLQHLQDYTWKLLYLSIFIGFMAVLFIVIPYFVITRDFNNLF